MYTYQSPEKGRRMDKQVGITSVNVHVIQSRQKQTCSGGEINSSLIPNSGRRTDRAE